VDIATVVAITTSIGAGAILDRTVARLFGRKAAQIELAAAAVAVANEVLIQVRSELESCRRQRIEIQASLAMANQQIFALRTELAAFRRNTGNEVAFEGF